MITFRCGKCAVLIQSPERWAGRPVTCKKCQHVTVCPESSILVPLRPSGPSQKRSVGNPDFYAALGAIGVACLIIAMIVAGAFATSPASVRRTIV